MKRSARKDIFSASLAAIALSLGGCETSPAKQPAAAPARVSFEGRSLADPGLERFLRANLGPVPSQWDFETLSWVSFYYNPSLELARAQWEVTQAARSTAQARANPTLSITPGFNSSRQAGVTPWFPSVNLDFLLPRSERRRQQQDIARAEAESARLAVVATAWTVRSDLRTALIEAAAARQRSDSLRAQASVQRELLALLSQRQSAGMAAASEVSTVRLALLRAETAAAEAASKHSAARAKVAVALGVPLAAIEGLLLPSPEKAITLSSGTLTEVRRDALHSRADILAALAKIEAAESAVALETSRRWPEFHVGPGYQYDQGANKWSVALSLELPLLNHNEGPIAEAVAKRNEAAAHLLANQAQAIAALESATLAQSAATDQLTRAQQVRAEAGRLEMLAQQRFSLGAADKVEHLTARLEVVLAESAVVEASAAVAQAVGQLEDALQLPFSHIEQLGAAATAPTLKAP